MSNNETSLKSEFKMEGYLPAYILCGGKSTRMQEEKGLVLFRGKSFIQWILDAVEPLALKSILVTKNKDYRPFGLKMVRDVIEDQGPIGGIYTALLDTSEDHILILSCDIPKVSTEVLALLIAKSKCFPEKITFLSDEINDYPLIGIYPKSILKSFSQAIESGHLKLCKLVYDLPHQRLIIDPAKKISLQNINSKEQLLSLT